MKDWGKIAVGSRIGGSPDPMFVSSLLKLVTRGMRKGDVLLDPIIEIPHHYAAENMANYFLKTKADTLLMLDDDMVFECDQLAHLRDDKRGWEYDMLGAMYQSRKPPHYPLCIVHDPESPTGFSNMVQPPKNSIQQVGVVGLGFTLVRREIFKKIIDRKPPKEFIFYWHIYGDSEDACFCHRVEDAGGKIGVHTGIPVGHRMGVVLRWDTEEGGTRLFTRGMRKAENGDQFGHVKK